MSEQEGLTVSLDKIFALAGLSLYSLALPLTRLGNWFFASNSVEITLAFGITCVLASILFAFAAVMALKGKMRWPHWICFGMGILFFVFSLGAVFTLPWLVPYTIDGSGMRSPWGPDMLIVYGLILFGVFCGARSLRLCLASARKK